MKPGVHTILLFYLLILLSWTKSFAQEDVDPNTADRLFRSENYREALPYYGNLTIKDPSNAEYNFRLGVCYLHASSIMLSQATPYLEKAEKSRKAKPEYTLWLGKSYLYNGEPEKAEAMFTKYKEWLVSQNLNSSEAELLISNCISFREVRKKPVNVVFENLGPVINSGYDDYNPFVSDNESFMIFNSLRGPESKVLPNGKMMADVFISTDMLGKWKVAKGIGNMINEPERNEEVVGVSADGKTVVLAYSTDSLQGDLIAAPKEGDRFFEPQRLSKPINSPGSETSATLSPDGNTIYFASNRDGTMGDHDIYRVTKLPNGEWSEPMNLGDGVNTKQDEDLPFISADGKKLYFCSKGHNSIGGYDIFVSTWNEEENKWQKAENIGFPINTPLDNKSFCVSSTGRYGYFAASLADSYGGLDIYRVVFLDVEPEKTLIKGYVASSEGDRIETKVILDVYDGKKLIGTYVPNQYSGKYIMILEPGEYSVTGSASGYKTLNSTLKVYDKSSFERERVNEIYLLEK